MNTNPDLYLLHGAGEITKKDIYADTPSGDGLDGLFFDKGVDSFKSIFKKGRGNKEIEGPYIDLTKLQGEYCGLVEEIARAGIPELYKEGNIETRANIALAICDMVKDIHKLTDYAVSFEDLGRGHKGSYIHDERKLVINSSFLENPSSFGDLLHVILHENRHALQYLMRDHPEYIKGDMFDMVAITENLKPENYIRPEYDYWAYLSQPVEKDADFAALYAMSYFEKLLA